jgi:hypothetical protein
MTDVSSLFCGEVTVRARRRRSPVRAVVAVTLIGAAGFVTLDALTPAAPRPAVSVAVAHHVEAAVPAVSYTPRPAASHKPLKLHIVRAITRPLRMVRHVHRVFRIVRHPFRVSRWFW